LIVTLLPIHPADFYKLVNFSIHPADLDVWLTVENVRQDVVLIGDKFLNRNVIYIMTEEVTTGSFETRRKIKEIINTSEGMDSVEIRKQLVECLDIADKNGDTQIKQEITWEIAMIWYPVWYYYLNEANGKEFAKPFSNTPEYEWKKESVDYYKERFKNTENQIAKARYAFAVMTLGSGNDRINYAKDSFEFWLKTAEESINKKTYIGYCKLSPFAYRFSIKLALSFKQDDLFEKAFISLHKSVFKTIEDEDKSWNLELFEIESEGIGQLEGKVDSQKIEKIKKESIDKLNTIISEFEQEKEFNSLEFNTLRKYIACLIKYVDKEKKYDIESKFAESWVSEAKNREKPLAKKIFYELAIKNYNLMQDRYPDKKDEINKRIEELSLKAKESWSNIQWNPKVFKISIPKEGLNNYLKEYLNRLKKRNKNILYALLDDNSLFPKTGNATKPVFTPVITDTIQRKGEIVKEYIGGTTPDFFDKQQISISVGSIAIFLKMIFEEMQKEINLLKEVETLLGVTKIEDIKPTLSKGFNFVFEEPKDPISGVHILMPYVEEIIRRIIVKSGKRDNVLKWEKQKDGKNKTIKTIYFRKIELGGLLDNPEVRSIIGDDFADHLKVFLTERGQKNFRNELLHGLLESKEITETDALFLAYILLKLIKILKDTK